MKTGRVLLLTLGLCLAGPRPSVQAALPLAEIIKQAIVKVIKAADLVIQREQNKVIWLQNAQKALENTMAKLKLEQIADWLEQHRKLYADYFEELARVKQTLAFFHRIRAVSLRYYALEALYQRTWTQLQQDPTFTPDERAHMNRVYRGILQASGENMQRLLLVVESFRTRMTDAERLALIEAAADAVEKNYEDLLRFNQQNLEIRLGRAHSQREREALRRWYGSSLP